MRRLSKSWLDGEDSFVDFSNSAGRRKVQHLIHPAIMVNRKVDVGMEVSPGSSIQPLTPALLPKHPTLLHRLTTKLRITTPPSSPPSNILSFDRPSPTRLTMAHKVNSSDSRELHEATLCEHDLLSPNDSSVQEVAQDTHIPTFVQDDTSDSEDDWNTEAKRIKRRWEARNQGPANAVESGLASKTRVPIYPEVLVTPQFGRSKSTTDLAQLKPMNDESVATQSTSMTPASWHSLLKATQISKISLTHRASSSTSSPSMFPSPQKWLRVPTRINPLITANVPFASSTSLTSASSRSFLSSGGNDFVADDASKPLSTGSVLPGSGRRLVNSKGSSGIASVNPGADATCNNVFGVKTRNLDVERTPTIVKKHVGDGEAAESIIVQIEGDTDVARPTLPCLEDSRANDPGEQKGPPTIFAIPRPRNADLHTAMHTGKKFAGRAQRRKSFVEQSFRNLRKSITGTISRARPKLPTIIPSESRSVHGKFEASQLPSFPTSPVSPSARS